MNILKSKKGFTLVELIVVIAIFGILAAVLIPNLTSYIEKTKRSAAEQNAISIQKEFIASVDVATEDIFLDSDYVVVVDGYLVVIEDGALSGSYKTVIELETAKGVDLIQSDLEFERGTEPTDLVYFILDANVAGYLLTDSYYTTE